MTNAGQLATTAQTGMLQADTEHHLSLLLRRDGFDHGVINRGRQPLAIIGSSQLIADQSNNGQVNVLRLDETDHVIKAHIVGTTKNKHIPLATQCF